MRERVQVAKRVRSVVRGRSADAETRGGAAERDPRGPHERPALPPHRMWSLRWQPGRRATIGVAGAMVVAAALALSWTLSSRAQQIPVTQAAGPDLTVQAPAGPGSASAAGSAPGSPVSVGAGGSGSSAAPAPSAGSGIAGPPSLVVYVAGNVRHPGIYHFAPGARVYDAVNAAGGVSPGAQVGRLNLAAKIADGQQIVVGVSPGPGVDSGDPQAESGTGAANESGPVDLNSATGAQLQALPGVGPVLAQRILDWRSAHGPFTTIEQLQQVSGIGPAKLASLRAHVSV